MKQLKYYKKLQALFHNIIFQHRVALVNDLIIRGSLESATSCTTRSSSVCCDFALLQISLL
jgi:hypothetical protein